MLVWFVLSYGKETAEEIAIWTWYVDKIKERHKFQNTVRFLDGYKEYNFLEKIVLSCPVSV